MKILTIRRLNNFWQLARQWFKREFDAVKAAVSNIDLSPISDGIAEVKDAIEHIQEPDLSALAKEATATTNKNEVKQEMRKVAGPCILPDLEAESGIPTYNNYLGYDNDGEYTIDADYETDLDPADLKLGSIIKVTGLPTEEFDLYVPKTVDESSVYSDDNVLYGVTETLVLAVGKYYIITGIYDDTAHAGNAIYTYNELDDATVTDLVNKALKRLNDKIDDIDIDTSDLAKESQTKDGNDTAISVAKDVRSELGTGSDTAAETGTLFAVLKWTKNKVKDIYNAITDSTNGLSAIKTSAASAATDAAAARVAAQSLTYLESDINAGKTALAAAITAKGVTTSPTQSMLVMAQNISSIAQEPTEIDGGEMYAKQLFGSLATPNYWNLYEVLMQLLSDGRLVNYGGILLAEYNRGDDSLALSGAGAGGAYVVSDMVNGQFKMYTNDTTHTWDTEDDGRGNRWVAYCFADEYHDFQITDTNTSPRSIFIGRNVGTIKSLVSGRVSQIVVPDGNELLSFYNNGTYAQNFGKDIVLKTTGTLTTGYVIYNSESVELLYYTANEVKGGVIARNCSNLSYAILKIGHINMPNFYDSFLLDNSSLKNLIIECPDFQKGVIGVRYVEYMYIKTERMSATMIGANNTVIYIYIGYCTNDKTKGVGFNIYGGFSDANIPNDIELQDGWCKPLSLEIFNGLTEENMYAHILQRLKRDEPDCGDGVTITLGATNLAKLTSAESVQLLDDLTNIYGYTFA